MKGFRFLNFRSYKTAKELRFSLQPIENRLEAHRTFALKDQLSRATLSIILNIAEGSARYSNKDFKRFLVISLGSLFEVVACLDVCRSEKIITEAEYQFYLDQSNQLAAQLGAFMRALS